MAESGTEILQSVPPAALHACRAASAADAIRSTLAPAAAKTTVAGMDADDRRPEEGPEANARTSGGKVDEPEREERRQPQEQHVAGRIGAETSRRRQTRDPARATSQGPSEERAARNRAQAPSVAPSAPAQAPVHRPKIGPGGQRQDRRAGRRDGDEPRIGRHEGLRARPCDGRRPWRAAPHGSRPAARAWRNGRGAGRKRRRARARSAPAAHGAARRRRSALFGHGHEGNIARLGPGRDRARADNRVKLQLRVAPCGEDEDAGLCYRTRQNNASREKKHDDGRLHRPRQHGRPDGRQSREGRAMSCAASISPPLRDEAAKAGGVASPPPPPTR